MSARRVSSAAVAFGSEGAGTFAAVNSEARTNASPPQLGQGGSVSAAASDTTYSQETQRNVPVPTRVPDVCDSMSPTSVRWREWGATAQVTDVTSLPGAAELAWPRGRPGLITTQSASAPKREGPVRVRTACGQTRDRREEPRVVRRTE